MFLNCICCQKPDVASNYVCNYATTIAILKTGGVYNPLGTKLLPSPPANPVKPGLRARPGARASLFHMGAGPMPGRAYLQGPGYGRIEIFSS